MNWNDPLQRLILIESVGHEEYNRRINAWIESQVVETVNGYKLRWMPEYGMCQVMSTNVAFGAVAEARDYANTLPLGPHA